MPKETPLSQKSHFAIECCTSSLANISDKQLIYNSKGARKKQEEFSYFQDFFQKFPRLPLRLWPSSPDGHKILWSPPVRTGAAGLGDIGRHFPDSDEQYKDISSLLLLDKVMELIWQSGYTVENIDCTVIMLKPKIAPYTEQMKNNIAQRCRISPQQVNVKATTEEGAGLGEGAAGAHAVCLLGGGSGFFGAIFT